MPAWYSVYIYSILLRGPTMLPEYTREELAAGLDRVAEQILAKAGVRTPPVDAFFSPTPWASPWRWTIGRRAGRDTSG